VVVRSAVLAAQRHLRRGRPRSAHVSRLSLTATSHVNAPVFFFDCVIVSGAVGGGTGTAAASNPARSACRRLPPPELLRRRTGTSSWGRRWSFSTRYRVHDGLPVTDAFPLPRDHGPQLSDFSSEVVKVRAHVV